MQTPDAANQQLFTLFQEAEKCVPNQTDSAASKKTKTVALLRFDGKEFHFEKRWGADNGRILGAIKRWLQNIVICISGKKGQYDLKKNWKSIQNLFTLSNGIVEHQSEREKLANIFNSGPVKHKSLEALQVKLQPEENRGPVQESFRIAVSDPTLTENPVSEANLDSEPKIWWETAKEDVELQKSKKFETLKISDEGKFAEEIGKCKNCYDSVIQSHQAQLDAVTGPKKGLMGHIKWVPHEFSFFMPGIALMASYLAEKRSLDPANKYANNLYSCETQEAFSQHLHNISRTGTDGRYAYIVPAISSYAKRYGIEEDSPQHKIAVLVEKKNGELKIAIMNPQPGKESIQESHFIAWTDNKNNAKVWEGHGNNNAFTAEELILRSICKAGISNNDPSIEPKEGDPKPVTKTDVYVLPPEFTREFAFGCAMFALSDCETFLMDDSFFQNMSHAKQKSFIEKSGLSVGYANDLGPDYMLGAQSFTNLDAYAKTHPDAQSKKLLGKKTTFKEHVDHHKAKQIQTEKGPKDQNQYIMWKMYLYSHLVNKALALLTPDQLQEKINKHLVRG